MNSSFLVTTAGFTVTSGPYKVLLTPVEGPVQQTIPNNPKANKYSGCKVEAYKTLEMPFLNNKKVEVQLTLGERQASRTLYNLRDMLALLQDIINGKYDPEM